MQVLIKDISRVDDGGTELNSYLEFLTEQEHKYYESVASSKRRKQFLVGRFMLRSELSKLIGIRPEKIEITSTPNGKLILDSRYNLDFNIGHSKDRVALVIAATKVGIDIEFMKDRNFLEIAKEYFAEKEFVDIAQQQEYQQKKEKFYLYWTQKEALVKCVGGRILQDIKHKEAYDFSSYKEGDYFISVASLLKQVT